MIHVRAQRFYRACGFGEEYILLGKEFEAGQGPGREEQS